MKFPPLMFQVWVLTFLADPNGQNPAAWYTQLHHPLSSGLLHLHLWVDKQFWGSFSVKLDLNTGRTEIEIPVLKKKNSSFCPWRAPHSWHRFQETTKKTKGEGALGLWLEELSNQWQGLDIVCEWTFEVAPCPQPLGNCLKEIWGSF